VSLPEITDEDRAVYIEALRLWNTERVNPVPGEIAAALVRTGWTPVDPDLILAREVAADTAFTYGFHAGVTDAMRRGADDTDRGVRSALAAIKAADARRKGA